MVRPRSILDDEYFLHADDAVASPLNVGDFDIVGRRWRCFALYVSTKALSQEQALSQQ